MQSHFTTHTLAEIFRDLYLGERKGVLALKADDVEKRIHFDRGLIVFAESDLPQEDLGRSLIEDGKLSTGALEEARANTEFAEQLAEILVNRDLVAKEALLETVQRVVRRVVSSVFQWEGGTAKFAENHDRPYYLESDVLSTCSVILAGVSGMNQFRAIHDAMMGLDNRLCLSDPPPVPVERLTLSPAQGFILSRLDGATAVRDVVSLLPPGEEEQATRFLYGLLVLGVVGYDPPLSEGPFRVANILRDHADRRAMETMQEKTIRRAYSQMSQQDPYEILGVAPAASAPAIERAYEEAKALFHRDRLLPQIRDRFRAELAVIESRLIEAYVKLNQPETVRPDEGAGISRGNGGEGLTADDLLVRVEMDKTKSKLAHEKATKVADGYYAQARKAMRDGDYHNAIQYGKLAISYNENDARYYHIVAECQSRNPGARWQHLAEQNFTKSTELDPWNPDYFIELGRFYKRRGLALRARKQFEEALRLYPQHEAATEELRTLA